MAVARPISWLAQNGYQDGKVWLELPEIDVTGWANVVEIGPAPDEQSGHGCLVLMTIQHVANEVLELRLSDGESFQATPAHRFYREDTGWTALRDLVPGDELRSADADVTVIGVDAAGSGQIVYNLEVGAAHTYRVGWGRVWTHNAYADKHHIMTNKNDSSSVRGGPWTPRFRDLAAKAGDETRRPVEPS